jgi:(p)ppGpp synthase/HD superfamily hydrolase
MTAGDQARLTAALAFALEHHGSQTRKGKSVPYVAHLLQVAGLILEHGGGVDEAVAGLLHDTLEDCEDVTEAVLHQRFGPAVTRIVANCTDTLEGDTPDEKSPWKQRKLRYLAQLRQADAATHLVSACDKLHNLCDMLADIRREGLTTLERFNAAPTELLWYFESVHRVASPSLPDSLAIEFGERIAELRRSLGG